MRIGEWWMMEPSRYRNYQGAEGAGGFKWIGHPPSIYFKLDGAQVSATEELERSGETPFAWVYIYGGFSISFEI
jgi:hypothetical protein